MNKTLARISVAAMALPFGLSAFAADGDGVTSALDAVDLSGIATKVVAAGLLIVGVALAFKGPSIAKRVISKV